VKTRIVRIGNSQGVRIPKPLIAASGLPEEVELEVQEGAIVIRAAGRPRAGWEVSFRRMAELGEDRLLDSEVAATKWDEAEWEW
jgi:antitoxin MazE